MLRWGVRRRAPPPLRWGAPSRAAHGGDVHALAGALVSVRQWIARDADASSKEQLELRPMPFFGEVSACVRLGESRWHGLDVRLASAVRRNESGYAARFEDGTSFVEVGVLDEHGAPPKGGSMLVLWSPSADAAPQPDAERGEGGELAAAEGDQLEPRMWLLPEAELREQGWMLSSTMGGRFLETLTISVGGALERGKWGGIGRFARYEVSPRTLPAALVSAVREQEAAGGGAASIDAAGYRGSGWMLVASQAASESHRLLQRLLLELSYERALAEAEAEVEAHAEAEAATHAVVEAVRKLKAPHRHAAQERRRSLAVQLWPSRIGRDRRRGVVAALRLSVNSGSGSGSGSGGGSGPSTGGLQQGSDESTGGWIGLPVRVTAAARHVERLSSGDILPVFWFEPGVGAGTDGVPFLFCALAERRFWLIPQDALLRNGSDDSDSDADGSTKKRLKSSIEIAADSPLSPRPGLAVEYNDFVREFVAELKQQDTDSSSSLSGAQRMEQARAAWKALKLSGATHGKWAKYEVGAAELIERLEREVSAAAARGERGESCYVWSGDPFSEIVASLKVYQRLQNRVGAMPPASFVVPLAAEDGAADGWPESAGGLRLGKALRKVIARGDHLGNGERRKIVRDLLPEVDWDREGGDATTTIGVLGCLSEEDIPVHEDEGYWHDGKQDEDEDDWYK